MSEPIISGYPYENPYSLYFGRRISFIQKKAEQGDAEAQFQLARYYYWGWETERDPAKAVEWYTKAAEQGDVWAQINLGDLYYSGNCVEKDYSKAVEWYTKAVEQKWGWGLGQYKLGMCYLNGEGVPQDYKMALKMFLKAAKKGYKDGQIKAQIALGDCYKNGKGVRKNSKKVVEWYTKAAELHNKDNEYNKEAQYKLAKCYEDGFGVEKDIIKAKILYRKAIDYPEASKALNDLLSNPAYAEILKKHKKDLKEYKEKVGEYYNAYSMVDKWFNDFSDEDREKYMEQFETRIINGVYTIFPYNDELKKKIKDFEEYKKNNPNSFQKRYSMSKRKIRKWISETSDEEWEEYMQDFEPNIDLINEILSIRDWRNSLIL